MNRPAEARSAASPVATLHCSFAIAVVLAAKHLEIGGLTALLPLGAAIQALAAACFALTTTISPAGDPR
eukprot:CAMPEP_0204329786 /NCGR_PEP_ID=MMETSP0469-20131031/14430_1 /ASSEMBLY_ACC=CAM_ASM_000384 /TAXON_ID=2969 /ORGANISM="Oxyrrhis marina" /LENGTH=68 /DNA_ID=CAMNT_0051312459 /DNA_START=102 /DNA_END=305 /DNA_ORIENTATION=+